MHLNPPAITTRPCLMALLAIVVIAFPQNISGEHLYLDRVFIATEPSVGERNINFEKVVSESLRLEVEKLGFLVLSTEEKKPAVTENQFLDAAKNAHCGLGVHVLYQVKENMVDLSILLYDVVNSFQLSTIQGEHALSLNFDIIVSEELQDLILGSGMDPEQIVEFSLNQRQLAEKRRIEEEKKAADEKTRRERQTNAAAAARTMPPLHVAEFKLGVGPSFLVGSAATDYNIGLIAMMHLGLLMIEPKVQFELGLTTGIQLYLPENSSVERFLFPLAVSGSIGTITGTRFDLYLIASAGPALMISEGSTSGTQIVPVAYLAGGGGVEIAFLTELGLNVSGVFAAILGDNYPILGIVPSVHLFVKR